MNLGTLTEVEASLSKESHVSVDRSRQKVEIHTLNVA